MADQDKAYHPKDAIGRSIKSTAIAGGAGAMMSAVMTSLARTNVGAMAFFTRSGWLMVNFGNMIDLHFDFLATNLGRHGWRVI